MRRWERGRCSSDYGRLIGQLDVHNLVHWLGTKGRPAASEPQTLDVVHDGPVIALGGDEVGGGDDDGPIFGGRQRSSVDV